MAEEQVVESPQAAPVAVQEPAPDVAQDVEDLLRMAESEQEEEPAPPAVVPAHAEAPAMVAHPDGPMDPAPAAEYAAPAEPSTPRGLAGALAAGSATGVYPGGKAPISPAVGRILTGVSALLEIVILGVNTAAVRAGLGDDPVQLGHVSLALSKLKQGKEHLDNILGRDEG